MGGRGASSSIPTAHPSGGGTDKGKWSNAPNIQSPKSLREALGTKGKPMSMYDAVMGANPYYDNTGTYNEFTRNCQRCVVAYEARRRGYDVIAQPTYLGDNTGQIISVPNGTINGRWQGAFQGAKSERVGGSSSRDVYKNIESKMNSYGEGSRAVIGLQWKGGGAHVFNVERKNGTTFYIDAQVGVRYRPLEVLSRAKPNNVTLVRTDNLKFSNRTMKTVEQSGYRIGNKK